MIGSKIKEHIEYAICVDARKGVKDEDLHKLGSVSRVKVLSKGHSRFAPTAKDAYSGEITGEYKNDGIQVVNLERYNGKPILDVYGAEATRVLKARDFLMPWTEYQCKRDTDDEAQRLREAEAAERQRIAEEKHENALNRLISLGISPEAYDRGHLLYVERDGKKLYVGESSGVDSTHLTDDGLDFIVGRISERVYELLSEQS